MGKQLISFDVKTMTLKEITDLLGVRHNNAIRVVEELLKDQEFGLATQIEYPIISGKGREQLINTYELNKRQSLAVASRLSTKFLMRLVDRWQELEDQAKKLDKSWKDVRGLTMDCFKEMCESLNEQRNISGKKTKAYHFSNEARMINQIVLGVDSINRDNQEITVLKQIDNLSRTNISLINAGMDYKSRKSILERSLPKKITLITYED